MYQINANNFDRSEYCCITRKCEDNVVISSICTNGDVGFKYEDGSIVIVNVFNKTILGIDPNKKDVIEAKHSIVKEYDFELLNMARMVYKVDMQPHKVVFSD